MDWISAGTATLGQRKQLFEDQQRKVTEQLRDLQQVQEVLEYKCWYYEEALKRGSEEAVDRLPFDELPAKIQRHYPLPK